MSGNDSTLCVADWYQSLSRRPWKSCSLGQPLQGPLSFLHGKSNRKVSLEDNNDRERELLPLIIGITGHRDIAQTSKPAVEKALRRVFTDLRKSCPHTPLLLLSPLAEGADRIATKVFLELPHTQLVIPMPMDLASYRETFSENDATFDDLLKRHKHFVIPLPDAKTSPWDTRAPNYAEKPDCFEALGLYIAEHCHVLVAVWDNIFLEKIGGASQVVKVFLTGQPNFGLAAECLVQPRQRRPVIQIWTERQSANPVTEAVEKPRPGTIEILTLPCVEEKDSLEDLTRTLLRLNATNEAFLNLDASQIDKDHFCRMPEEYLIPQEKKLRLLSAQANPFATDYAKKLRNNLLLMVTLAAVSIGCFALFRLSGYRFWLGALGGGTTILALLLAFLCVKLSGWQNKHLYYRGFIEALRILFFWKLEGIPAEVIKKCYTEERVHNSSENRWMRESVAYIELARDRFSSPREVEGEKDAFSSKAKEYRKTAVLESWIENQRSYFGREREKAEKAHHRWLFVFLSCAILGSAFVVISRILEGMEHTPGGIPGTMLSLFVPFIMIAMAESLFFQFMPHLDKRRHHTFRGVLLALCLSGWLFPTLWPEIRPFLIPATLLCGYLLLPISALAGSYMKLSAFSENAKRYKESHALFSRVYDLVKEEKNELRRQEIIIYLGKQALAENSIWIRQHVERPVGLPVSRRNF